LLYRLVLLKDGPLESVDLLLQLTLIGNLLLLDVPDYAELMFLEDLVILMHFLILLLRLGSSIFALVLDPSRALQLGLIFIKLLILNGFDPLQLLQLICLILYLLLKLLHVQRCLGLCKVLLTF
jgi:hypothetical protein